MSKVRLYYNLAKPRLAYGNVFTTLAGYLFASHWHLVWPAFPAVLFGTLFVIGSACVINNCLDRDMDVKMLRTKDRALVTGAISVHHAYIYAAVLGILGFSIVYFGTNTLTTLVIAAGFLIYVFPYTASKRVTSAAAIIGSFAGATPLVAGYVAVTGTFDLTALILFCILAIWQVPHFYSIATYRGAEYAEANIPTVPAVRGARWINWSIPLYIAAYLIAVASLFYIGKEGYAYVVIVGIPALWWFYRSLQGSKAADRNVWARGLFKISLLSLMAFSIGLAIGVLLP
jgi:protoheme IX farnesyltransferase